MNASIRTTPRPRQCSTIARGLRRVERQRLLAEDVLAGVGRREDPGLVQLVRQRDVDRVDLGVVEQALRTSRRPGAPRTPPPRPAPSPVAAGQGLERSRSREARMPGIRPRRVIRAQPRMPQRSVVLDVMRRVVSSIRHDRPGCTDLTIPDIDAPEQEPRGSARPKVAGRASKRRNRPGSEGSRPGAVLWKDPGDDRLSRQGHYHGPGGLNGRVRNGNGCGPAGMVAGKPPGRRSGRAGRGRSRWSRSRRRGVSPAGASRVVGSSGRGVAWQVVPGVSTARDAPGSIAREVVTAFRRRETFLVTHRRTAAAAWCGRRVGVVKRSAVGTGPLRRSPAVHSQPIDLVVFQEPS